MLTLLSLEELGGEVSENLQYLGLNRGDFDGLEVLQWSDIHSYHCDSGQVIVPYS